MADCPRKLWTRGVVGEKATERRLALYEVPCSESAGHSTLHSALMAAGRMRWDDEGTVIQAARDTVWQEGKTYDVGEVAVVPRSVG